METVEVTGLVTPHPGQETAMVSSRYSGIVLSYTIRSINALNHVPISINHFIAMILKPIDQFIKL